MHPPRPDQSVVECAERLVVEVSGSAVLVVERASSRTLAEAQNAQWSMASQSRRLRK